MARGDLHRPTTHAELVVNSLLRWPTREAFRQDGRSLSYAESAGQVARFARVMRALSAS